MLQKSAHWERLARCQNRDVSPRLVAKKRTPRTERCNWKVSRASAAGRRPRPSRRRQEELRQYTCWPRTTTAKAQVRRSILVPVQERSSALQPPNSDPALLPVWKALSQVLPASKSKPLSKKPRSQDASQFPSRASAWKRKSRLEKPRALPPMPPRSQQPSSAEPPPTAPLPQTREPPV